MPSPASSKCCLRDGYRDARDTQGSGRRRERPDEQLEFEGGAPLFRVYEVSAHDLEPALIERGEAPARPREERHRRGRYLANLNLVY
jgi:hypothetical protein